MTAQAHRVLIAGMGGCSAVGRGVPSMAAAVRAGIAGFSAHPFLVDTAGEPMRAAIASWLDVRLQGLDRLAALLMPAVDEALVGWDVAMPPERIALALALPSPRPGRPHDIAAQLVRRIQEKRPGAFGGVATFEAGHAAGLLGIRAAFLRLRQGTLDACLVAGVDSWIVPQTLEWLEANDQLHGAGPLNNAWGFIPGEGAAALLLVRENAATDRATVAAASVLAVAQAREPNVIKGNTVCVGEGLTDAFRTTLDALPPGTRVSDIYCDMNGEPYRADEFGFAVLRTKDSFVHASDFNAPADCWGDVGAAGSLLHAALACTAASRGYAKGGKAFIWGSSETGERASLLLDAPHRA